MKIKKDKIVAKPFLKWAGGKNQLLDKFEDLYPKELINGEIDTYIEPFVGAGSVLFHILQKYKVNKAIIIDLNKELINCYSCIKFDVNKLIIELQKLQSEFLLLSMKERKQSFLKIRKKYNNSLLNNIEHDFKKAAYFIFLNKTCFNGLYRVNKKGEFNVPFGKYMNPLICDSKNLILISNLLKNVEIKYADYSTCMKYIKDKTFIYFDPPYRPLVRNSSFTNYDKSGFNDNDQTKLAEFIKKLDEKALLMLSNSDPKNTNIKDNFFDDLYKGFNIDRIQAKRMINCVGNKRGNINEIIIRNYQNKELNIRYKTFYNHCQIFKNPICKKINIFYKIVLI